MSSRNYHVKPDPAVWKKALELARGNAKRLKVNRDGSVTVTNESPKASGPAHGRRTRRG